MTFSILEFKVEDSIFRFPEITQKGFGIQNLYRDNLYSSTGLGSSLTTGMSLSETAITRGNPIML